MFTRSTTPVARGKGDLPHNHWMTEHRIIGADATREDDAVDASIRPKRMADYLGQVPVRVAVWGAIWAHAVLQVPRLLRAA